MSLASGLSRAGPYRSIHILSRWRTPALIAKTDRQRLEWWAAHTPLAVLQMWRGEKRRQGCGSDRINDLSWYTILIGSRLTVSRG